MKFHISSYLRLPMSSVLPGPERRIVNGYGGCSGVLVLYLAAAPYITVYRLKVAADKRDGADLSEFIEFPSVRQSFKDQLNAHLAQEMASVKDMVDNRLPRLDRRSRERLPRKWWTPT